MPCALTKNVECVQPPSSSFLTNSWSDLHSQWTHTSKTSPLKPCSQRPPLKPPETWTKARLSRKFRPFVTPEHLPVCVCQQEIVKSFQWLTSIRENYIWYSHCVCWWYFWGLWLIFLHYWMKNRPNKIMTLSELYEAYRPLRERRTGNQGEMTGNRRWGRMEE